MGKANTVIEVPVDPAEMRSRTRPGEVPPRVEQVDGLPQASAVIDEVIDGQPLYGVHAASAGLNVHSTIEELVPPVAAPTLHARVGDLEAREDQRNRHLLLLDRIVEQQTAEINGLRHQLGQPPWKPTVRFEDNPAEETT